MFLKLKLDDQNKVNFTPAYWSKNVKIVCCSSPLNKVIEGILETMRKHIREEMGDQHFSIQV